MKQTRTKTPHLQKDKTRKETAARIEAQGKELTFAQQGGILVDKGGESGETTTKANGQEELQLRVQQRPVLVQAAEEAYGKTAGQIDQKRTYRKESSRDKPQKKPGEQVTEHASQATAGTYTK